ncbi:DUF4189 domain-containing protein [Xanthomonas translucens pv. translucens]|uniref:DUF4189 domain-containing protein n=1 Tax=Xanthomonas translucens pv. translucens TaxID=134875 RepID=A0ABW9KYD6_XANCT|nr:DUF4189 domain-containing protein [Xanthomonas translucens]MCT8285847.1 DUF4189 domain-containing protein [Xanthomonas translucens pv. translucens]MCT8303505.1 DUF4189 domain-containing protein [Xanthomonas translucens pv. translucens]
MNMRWDKLSFLLFIFASSAMAEQGCPPGQYPIGGQGVAACAPIPQENPIQQQPRPSGKWIKTWGAVSLDKSDVGALGVSIGKLSKSEAQQDAIAGCVKAGGKDCRDWVAYENQCAAVAEPYRDGRSSAGTLHIKTGASPESIKKEVERICSQENGGECRVIYAACSEPIFQKY